MRIKIYIFIVLTIIIGFGPLFCKDNNDMSDTMIKNDYYEKERVILGINEAFLNHLYKDRININAYKEFNKVGIDLKELPYKLAGGTDFRENALTSDLVIIGRVLKIEYDKTQQDLSKNIYYAYYGSTYTIQVEEVLLGKDLYPKPPEQVFIKRRSGLYSSVSFETVHLEIGKQYIFFLTRHPLKLLKEI